MMETVMNDNDNKFRSGCIDFISGSLGGIALVYVSQPLDTVKVKMQAFPNLYRGMAHCLLVTYKKDRIYHGLYAGTVPALVANVAENSVLFAAYGGCQKAIAYTQGLQSTKELSVLGNAFAGFFAAFFSTFTLCPTELVKCKIQALRESAKCNKNKSFQRITPIQLTKQIYQREGIRGFFRGLTPTFMREMPGYFVFFGGYEGTRELLRKNNQTKDDIGPLKTMFAGAVGGFTLWAAIFPFDVIKSRVQINNIPGSMTSVGIDIIRKEGFTALYNGLTPTLVRTIPATATLFLVYEYSKKFMESLF